jgi:hypothetical protein
MTPQEVGDELIRIGGELIALGTQLVGDSDGKP